jgi:fatty acid desaturase
MHATDRPNPQSNRLRSDAASAAVYGAHVFAVFAPVYIAAWFGPGWSTVLCWLWFGILSHGLLLLLHECIHKLAFRRVDRNERLARWLLAPLFVADFDAFRRRHWAHHRQLGLEGDPKYTYRIDIGGIGAVRLLLANLTGISAVRKFRHQVGAPGEATRDSAIRALLITLIVQPLFVLTIAAVAYLGHPHDWTATFTATIVAYAFVYGYGLASLTDLVHTLRGIAEHRRASGDLLVEHDAALRNFTHNPVDRLIFGTYGFADHATHHRFPAVPGYQLPALTRELMAAEPVYRPVGSHFATLVRLVFPREPRGEYAGYRFQSRER